MPTLTTDDFVRIVSLYIPETVTALTFSPDGSLIAVAAGDKVHLFQVPAALRPNGTPPPAPRPP